MNMLVQDRSAICQFWRPRLSRLARQHCLFGVAVLAGAMARATAMLGYPPIRWPPDGRFYMGVAMRMQPFAVRPSGYPVMLRLLLPFHSLVLVAGVQHAMGLATGIAVYALLRRRFQLPGWGATLAAAPVLLSAYPIQIEQSLFSDALFSFLVTAAVVGVLWWPDPPVWMWGLAGLTLAAATLTRSEGMPLVVAFLVYLAIRFRGWRSLGAAAAMCAAFALPLAGYASWFDSAHRTFQLTTSTGAFLYSRVIPFANCAVIRPPADERRLCLTAPVGQRRYAEYYVWHNSSPIRHVPGGEFGNEANTLGTDFALRAIRSQPLDYLAAVWHDTWQSFRPHRDPNPQGQSQNYYVFAASRPRPVPHRVYISGGYADQDGYSYNRANPNTRLVQPYAAWIRAYQRFAVVPGPLLGLIALAGLAGLALAWWHRSGSALLAWLTGMGLLVIPAATAGFDIRYLICAIPPLCIAAAIGVKEIADLRANRNSAARRNTDHADVTPSETAS